MRKYKSGSNWAFWRWTDVDSEYITRLHLIKTPWWAICLHWINKPDPEPWLHDHPVTFTSFVLKGWYREHRKVETAFMAYEHKDRLIDGINRIAAASWDLHSITDVSPGGCLTLCLMGPKIRDWGFHTDNGWVMWKDYYAAQRAEKV